MKYLYWLAIAAAVTGCDDSSGSGGGDDAGLDAIINPEAGADGGINECNSGSFTLKGAVPFNAFPTFGGSTLHGGPMLSTDGLTLYFHIVELGKSDLSDIWRAGPRIDARPDTPFPMPERVPGLDASDEEYDAFITRDDKQMYLVKRTFSRGLDIYRAWRADSSFASPSLVTNVSSSTNDNQPYISASGAMYLVVSENNNENIHVALSNGLGGFAAPVKVFEATPGLINSPADEHGPTLSPNELELYFVRDYDIHVAVRPNTSSPFESVQPVAELNSPGIESHPRLSFDGSVMYFVRDHILYYATRCD